MVSCDGHCTNFASGGDRQRNNKWYIGEDLTSSSSSDTDSIISYVLTPGMLSRDSSSVASALSGSSDSMDLQLASDEADSEGERGVSFMQSLTSEDSSHLEERGSKEDGGKTLEADIPCGANVIVTGETLSPAPKGSTWHHMHGLGGS